MRTSWPTRWPLAGLPPLVLAAALLGGCVGEPGSAAQPQPGSTIGPGTVALPEEGAGSGSGGADDAAEDLAGRPAHEILAAARSAALGAGSVRLVGDLTSADEQVGLDVRVGEQGAAGTVTLGGSQVELRRVGEQLYLRADAAFWDAQGGPGVGQLVGDRWFLVPADAQPLAELAAFTTVQGVVSTLLEPEGRLRRGERAEVAGRRALAVVADGDAGELRVWVALEETPYPLLVDAPESAFGPALELRDWDEPVDVEPPAADEVVTAEELATATTP